jgi:DNA topoisomerase-1
MQQLIKLPHDDIVLLNRDYARVARAVRLVYVNDAMPGITRVRKGKGFAYLDAMRRRVDREHLMRIKKLAIPPAWTRVWICPLENGHIQATGYDMRKRKQYRYHALWSEARNETKFHRLLEFGKVLPAIRARVEQDLSRRELCREKVLAAVISVMERTYIRVGSEDYEKLYGSYGITTLKDKHVEVTGGSIRFSFVGKKKIAHSITLRNKRLAHIIKQCRDIPGQELFQYYDAEGARHGIDSGMVNDYIREAAGADFTAKDFRTWAGSMNLLRSLKSLENAVSGSAGAGARKKNVLAALDEVSKKLGNTRAVCRKYYVHPALIRLYEENALDRYLKELDSLEETDGITGLTSDEKVLMRVLKEVM